MCRAPDGRRPERARYAWWWRSLFVGAAVWLAVPGCALAQTVPAKRIDPAPLDHPARLTSVATADPATVFASVRQAVKDAGFTATRIDLDRFMLDAKRTDAAEPKSYDRVIVWLERSPGKPLDQVDVYLLYGRYEEVVARRTDIYRVVVDEQFAANRVGALQASLMALGESQ